MPSAAAPPVTVASPDGRVRIELGLRRDGDADRVPHYRVLFRDTELIGPSRLGISLGDGTALGGPCEIVAVDTRSRRETYVQFPGKRREVTDQCTEAVIRLRESSRPGGTWEIVLRAYNDGAAFRYRFPAQAGRDKLVIAGEQTGFSVPAEARAFALPLNGFTTSYEKLYQVKPAGELPKDWLLGLPLLLEYPGGVWSAI